MSLLRLIFLLLITGSISVKSVTLNFFNLLTPLIRLFKPGFPSEGKQGIKEVDFMKIMLNLNFKLVHQMKGLHMNASNESGGIFYVFSIPKEKKMKVEKNRYSLFYKKTPFCRLFVYSDQGDIRVVKEQWQTRAKTVQSICLVSSFYQQMKNDISSTIRKKGT